MKESSADISITLYAHKAIAGNEQLVPRETGSCIEYLMLSIYNIILLLRYFNLKKNLTFWCV